LKKPSLSATGLKKPFVYEKAKAINPDSETGRCLDAVVDGTPRQIGSV
jgi:hypothetical protein